MKKFIYKLLFIVKVTKIYYKTEKKKYISVDWKAQYHFLENRQMSGSSCRMAKWRGVGQGPASEDGEQAAENLLAPRKMRNGKTQKHTCAEAPSHLLCVLLFHWISKTQAKENY